MTWSLVTRSGSWGHFRSTAPGTDMPTLKAGDWKVASDQAFIRKDNALADASVPTIDNIAPDRGQSNQTFPATVNGSGFAGVTGVTFGGTACTAITVVNSGQITCTFPSKPNGNYPVVVTNPLGSSDSYMYRVN
jgi:hypothetical protein